ncbi:MAG: hypothetical protein UHM08_08595 [Bacteroidales bacterium]|jgi:hypothetical protein|nr:hypothetical protein [Bacteroidales bacterium]
MKKLTFIAVCLLFATTMFAQEKKVAFTFDVSFGKSTSYNTVGGLNVESSHITSFPNCLNYRMGAGIRYNDKLTFKIDYFHTANTYYFTIINDYYEYEAIQRIENLNYIGLSAAYSYKMGNSFELSPYLGIGVIMEKSESLYFPPSNTIIGRLNSKFATELGLSLEYKATKNLSFFATPSLLFTNLGSGKQIGEMNSDLFFISLGRTFLSTNIGARFRF